MPLYQVQWTLGGRRCQRKTLLPLKSDDKTAMEKRQNSTAQHRTQLKSQAKQKHSKSKSNEVKQVLVEAGHQRPKSCEELGPRPKTEHACHYKSLEISFGHWKKICSPNIEAAKRYTNYSTYSSPVIKFYKSIKSKSLLICVKQIKCWQTAKLTKQ